MTLISTAHAAEVTHPVSTSRSRMLTPTWSIQIGSFRTEQAARAAAAVARRAADGGEVRVEAASVGRKAVWRAQVTGLTASDAQEACASLAHRKGACFVIRPDTGDVASR
jgi:D-alanyl-D-alanine carboxypeptidase